MVSGAGCGKSFSRRSSIELKLTEIKVALTAAAFFTCFNKYLFCKKDKKEL